MVEASSVACQIWHRRIAERQAALDDTVFESWRMLAATPRLRCGFLSVMRAFARYVILSAVLMGLQAGLPPLDFSPLQGRGKIHYFAGIQAAMSENYGPLKEVFEKAIDRTWKNASSSSR